MFRWLVLGGWIFACGSPLFAYDREMGARALGMGDAFSALACSVDALNYNPAGLALGEDPRVALEYANRYPGMDDGSIQENHLAFAFPLKSQFGLGIGWNNRNIPSVYSENEFLAGVGCQPWTDRMFWTGATIKFFYQGYSDSQSLAANPYFGGKSGAYGVGLDWGALVEVIKENSFRPWVRAGLQLNNLNEPDLGLRNESRQFLEARLGAAAGYGEWDGALDLVYSNHRVEYHAGLEKWFQKKQWGVRTGFLAGQDLGLTWSTGGSYAFKFSQADLRLEYAFLFPVTGLQQTWGTHRLSLQAGLPSLDPGKRAVDGETLERVREYLLSKVDLFIGLSEKLPPLALALPPEKQGGMKSVEKSMHAAVGALVLEQDILGFLRNFEKALEKIKEMRLLERNPAAH